MSLSVRQFVHRHFLQEKPGGHCKTSEITDEHFGIKWRSTISTTRANCFTGICRYTCPESTTGAQVSVIARYFSVEGCIREQHFSKQPLSSSVGFITIFIEKKWRNDIDSYVELTFRVRAQFPLVHPRKKTRDFSVPTDVVLKVGDEKFHVSKMTLATHSSYFNSLFFGPFCESEKTEIELKEVDPEVLQAFLQILYHSADIDEDNVENLLEMARMYDVQFVTDQCENFLKGQNYLKVEEKKRLCEEYNLKYGKHLEALMRLNLRPEDGYEKQKEVLMRSSSSK